MSITSVITGSRFPSPPTAGRAHGFGRDRVPRRCFDRVPDRATPRSISATARVRAINRRRFLAAGFQGRKTTRDHRGCE
jgi:hypothetical protein